MLKNEYFRTDGAIERLRVEMNFFMSVAGVLSGEVFLAKVTLEWAVWRRTSVACSEPCRAIVAFCNF